MVQCCFWQWTCACAIRRASICKLAFIIEEKPACIRFPSKCNVSFGNAFVLVPHEKLTGASFYSSCNVFLGDGFIVVTEGKLACVRFP